MTYCLALKLNDGMVFASDSRTNAGVDQIACFKKMRTFVNDGDRVIVTMSSGNLSITQSAINLLEQRGRHADVPNLWNAESLFDVAMLLGDCLREVRKHNESFLAQSSVDMGANFIIGGQVRGEAPRLFLIYAEGNFIEASDETPYFQIGETKYGKPILDRVIHPNTPLKNAIKCAMVSFDSTMRSNISVGLPIDLVSLRRDSIRLDLQHHITEHDPYFSQISRRWCEGLRSVFDALPDPDWQYMATQQTFSDNF
jgi:putative proteasome-type protease